MTKFEIQYEGDGADIRAIRDIESYMGKDRFDHLVAVVNEGASPRQIDQAFHLFIGVEGFPVFAFMRWYFSPDEYCAWYDGLSNA